MRKKTLLGDEDGHLGRPLFRRQPGSSIEITLGQAVYAGVGIWLETQTKCEAMSTFP
jgi:hypothetical protein